MKKRIIAAFMLVVLLMSTIGSTIFAAEETVDSYVTVSFQPTEEGMELVLTAKENELAEFQYVVEICDLEDQTVTCAVAKELETFAAKNDGIVKAGIQFDTQCAIIGGVFANEAAYTGEIGTIFVEGGLPKGAEINVYRNGELVFTTSYSIGGTLGDVDGDDDIDAADALLTLKAVVKLVTLTEDQIACADVDGNQSIEAGDALLILQKVVNLIEIFPVEA